MWSGPIIHALRYSTAKLERAFFSWGGRCNSLWERWWRWWRRLGRFERLEEEEVGIERIENNQMEVAAREHCCDGAHHAGQGGVAGCCSGADGVEADVKAPAAVVG